ncbi:MAG: hypothetical protein JNL32_14490, partial [Candidatus Kapabacteria bacterium]|nr:hypothetical protein [Candidatus Kapabacteria bacterium]
MKTIAAFIRPAALFAALFSIISICGLHAQKPEIKWKPLGRQGLSGAHVVEFAQQRGGDMFMLTQQTLYRSSDGGSSWRQSAAGLPYGKETMFSLSAHASGKLFVGANDGIFASTDSARTWQRVDAPAMGRTRVRRFFMDTLGIIVASTYGQMFRSIDTGKTWHEIGQKIKEQMRQGYPILCYSWKNNWEVTFGTTALYSKDLGLTWAYVSVNQDTGGVIPPQYYCRNRVFDPKSSINVLFGNEGYVEDGIHITVKDSSSNLGRQHWAITPITRFYSTHYVWRPWDTMEIEDRHPGVIFLQNGDSILYGAHDCGIIKTCTRIGCGGGGQYRFNTGLGNLSITTVFKADNGRIFCGTRGGGPYYSTNSGITWNEGLEGLNEPSVLALLLPDAKNPKTFVAGTGAGVFVSDDSGATWQRRVNGLRCHNILTMERTPKGTILVGTLDGVFRSTNNGGVWTFCTTSPKSTEKYSVAAFAVTEYKAVTDFVCLKNGWIILSPFERSYFFKNSNNPFISKDDGQTWTICANGEGFLDPLQ